MIFLAQTITEIIKDPANGMANNTPNLAFMSSRRRKPQHTNKFNQTLRACEHSARNHRTVILSMQK